MRQSVKLFFAGVLVTLVLLGGYKAYAQYIDLVAAAKAGAGAYNYLAEPIAKNDKGEAITRAAVIDELVKKGLNGPAIPAVPVEGTTPRP